MKLRSLILIVIATEMLACEKQYTCTCTNNSTTRQGTSYTWDDFKVTARTKKSARKKCYQYMIDLYNNDIVTCEVK